MDFAAFSLLLAVGLFVGMLLLMDLGRRIGARHAARDPDGAFEGITAVDGAVFALLGLLVAFTFSGAATRFDTRRDLIVEETTAIEAAYLRLDLLPASAQPALRDLFRDYVDARLETYQRCPHASLCDVGLADTKKLQQKIWSQAVAAGRMEGVPPSTDLLVVPALNHMIDLTTKRTMATKMHPPTVIFVMLVVLSLAGAMLAGYDMAARRSRSWLHIAGFAAVMAISVYVILEIEYPRLGVIRLSTFDHALVELRASMR